MPRQQAGRRVAAACRPSAWCAVLVLLLTFPLPLAAQNALRRGAPIQPVALIRGGDLLMGAGLGYANDLPVALLDARADLTVVPVQLVYGLADGIVVEIRGDILRTLDFNSLGMPLVEPDDDVLDGASSGAGNFIVGAAFRLLGSDAGFSGGARIEFTIPSSNENEGSGTNSMSVRTSLLGSYQRGRLLFTGDLGIAILEAPLDDFEQNDVLVYSAELLYQPSPTGRLRLFAGVDGRVSTRNSVPTGTEDTGATRFGFDVRLGPFLFDAGGTVGYAHSSPAWGVESGLSFVRPRD